MGIYGLPSLTSISFGGNAAFTGTIYAPEADFSFGGGGNNTYDYVGSLVTNSCKLNGHANFHYDESLTGMATPPAAQIISDRESAQLVAEGRSFLNNGQSADALFSFRKAAKAGNVECP